MVINQILSRLEGVKRTHRGFIARCPAHDDRSPSLSLRQAEDRVLVHCFAGCGASDVMHSLGLTLADLFPENPQQHHRTKRWEPDYKALCHLARHETLCLVMATADIEKGKPLSADDLKTVERARRHLLGIWGELE